MARLRIEIVQALRTTAARLREGAPYQWGHPGACNCGHLAQTVTRMSQAQIYKIVDGEWSEYLNDYCPLTGQSLDDVAVQMIRFGFEPGELHDLEQLADHRVLRQLPGGFRYLQHNDRSDVALYLETWAGMIERRLATTEERELPGSSSPAVEPGTTQVA
ncbi:MAG: hypothetical protein AAGF11_36235 [Myxococcota bacterium]